MIIGDAAVTPGSCPKAVVGVNSSMDKVRYRLFSWAILDAVDPGVILPSSR